MKILVAMSGGVDSSVAAGLLVEQGHEVVGATLKLWGGASDSGCCSVADVDDARRVAQVLGVDHHVFNYTEEFERNVVAPFVAAHASGVTPNPCIDCNRYIKFDLFFERAARLGFEAVATGHHARVRRSGQRAQLIRGVDPAKDQSYVLGYLDAASLDSLLLPIGEMTKEQVRQRAESFGLRTWDKPDSQDVCFIEASKGRQAFLAPRIPLTAAVVIDRATGETIGSVPAAQLVTVGQRRGIAAGRDGERRFVTHVDLARGRVEVDRLADILIREIAIDENSWHTIYEELSPGTQVLVQVSAHGRVLSATVSADGRSVLILDEAVRPVAPGQSVVLYDANDSDVVIGAGVVSST
jgi:tRNA-specific 2-thiouridylase